jgi:hypothetical protein
MELLELPVEIFQLILAWSIQVRGRKRGLRLRLVSSMFTSILIAQGKLFLTETGLFARELIAVIFRFKLLDEYLSSREALTSRTRHPVVLPSFTEEYIRYRVLNEPASGNQALVAIRNVAQRLYLQNRTNCTKEQAVEHYVTELCARIIEFSRGHDPQDRPLYEVFTWQGPVSEGEFQAMLTCAAIRTGTFDIKGWIGVGRPELSLSRILGDPKQTWTNPRFGDIQTLKFLVLKEDGTPDEYLRKLAFMEAAQAGSLDRVRFFYELSPEPHTWDKELSDDVDNDGSDNEYNFATREGVMRQALLTPRKVIWDYLFGRRPEDFRHRWTKTEQAPKTLIRCAEMGWADQTRHMPLYRKLGLGWGNSVLGFVSLTFVPLAFLFYKYGGTLREKFPFQI